MLTITIDQKSIAAVGAGQIDLDITVRNLALPVSTAMVKCVQNSGHGYILSRAFQPGDGLLVISLENDGPLAKLDTMERHEALGRLLRCATLVFTGRLRSMPVSWRCYHYKNRVSFHADRRVRNSQGGQTEAGRLLVEITKDHGPRVFAFHLDQHSEHDIGAFRPNYALMTAALSGLSAALSHREATRPPDQLGEAVALGGGMQRIPSIHISLDDWYNARLTNDQRRFVDHPCSTSVRLVGPAGSGKTVAMVVKCLRDLHRNKDSEGKKRVLFLTHASSTASAIAEMVLDMDPEDGLAFLASDEPSLVITTLYNLANTQMRYDLDKLTPISLDGHEGRTFQADVLNHVISEFRKGDWIAFRSDCSSPFVRYMEASENSPERRFFLWELLNEFACVLDAEGVRSGNERRGKYLTDRRTKWMMVMESRQEREVVLRLYDGFRTWLKDVNAIGGDQMIADFLTHLDSYRWEATRDKEGYDAVFVDELHLFNRQERMVFRHLMRNPSSAPCVFMAYDAKQSPRDTFLGLAPSEAEQYDLWKEARLGKVEKIELLEVFRYTPQIMRALASIDQSFPGQDLDSDWPAYSGIASTVDGPTPTVCELENTMETHGFVFKRAKALQHKADKGKHIAVLCASYGLFSEYLESAELRDLYHPITSRDEAMGMPHAVRRFIFSMPEYVAGLQYDTVLLIDVNRDEVPEGAHSAAALRKFASQVYLGASRAERCLEIYASSEHGGIAPLVSQAVLSGVLQKVDRDALRDN